jgi:hypothetical protein
MFGSLSLYWKALKLVDECGNIWNCTLQFERKPDPYFKIGGGWNRMIKARGLQDVCVALLVLRSLA